MKYKPSVRELYELLRDGGADTWHVERGVTKSWDALMQTDEFADLNTRGMEERGRIFAPHSQLFLIARMKVSSSAWAVNRACIPLIC